MKHPQRILTVCLLAFFAFAIGCSDTKPKPKSTDNTESTHAHAHAPGDELVWEVKEKIADTEIEIWLGHHGTHFHGGDTIEPSVAIMKAGEAVADAKVFTNWLTPTTNLNCLAKKSRPSTSPNLQTKSRTTPKAI